MTRDLRPLDRVRSIKTKLGLLVAVTIVVAAVLAVIGTRLGISPWVTVAVAVVVALVVTQLLARGMTSPLREMTDAAQRMAQGDYSQRVHATSATRWASWPGRSTGRPATLEMVDRHRRDLVANVSHELRTPISALQAVLENLVDGVSKPGPEELRTALAQTQRLGRLVEDLLDLSRVEEGVTPLRLKEVRLAEIFDDAVAQARADGVRYQVDVQPKDPHRPADPDRLHQLLANLLDNATRHSPAGGEVRLSAERHGDGVRLAVADEGPGIAPADRGAVFERFTTSAAHSSGTGLGLAISRWVAQLHGGTIAVADGDRGCRIQVTIPSDADRPTIRKQPVMSSTFTPPAPYPGTQSIPPPQRDGLATYWLDAPHRRPAIVLAAVVAGVLASIVLPNRDLGVGTGLVVAAVVATVFAAGITRADLRSWTRLDTFDAALVALLLAPVFVRDAEWIAVLCLLAALLLTAVNSTKASSIIAVIATVAAVPLAVFRGTAVARPNVEAAQPGPRVAAGDPHGGRSPWSCCWCSVRCSPRPMRCSPPGWTPSRRTSTGRTSRRGPCWPPSSRSARWRRPSSRSRHRPSTGSACRWPRSARSSSGWPRSWCWTSVFLAFLVAQATVLFGGHDYLQRTIGLTYAEYVHQGFGQLTVATILTLTVVAWAARKATPGRRRDLALGALCLMTIVVTISALYRIHLYEEASASPGSGCW